MFQIVLTSSAEKELKKLDLQVQKRLSAAIDSLKNGLNANCKKLQGTKLRYRLRVGDYRIILELNQGKLIICVIRIGHRREVYRD